jgi:hypothetical protein
LARHGSNADEDGHDRYDSERQVRRAADRKLAGDEGDE